MPASIPYTASRQSAQPAVMPMPQTTLAASQATLAASLLPLQQHSLRNNSPVHLGLNNMPNHFTNAAMMNAASVPGVNMSSMMPAAPFHHAPMNPKVQQTIQQRQKLPSPISELSSLTY